MDDRPPCDVELRPSPIRGLGGFALHAFAGGGRIRRINATREVTFEAPLRPEFAERADRGENPDGRTVPLGFPGRHLNHSCDSGARVIHEPGPCFRAARRAIRAGEEITCDSDTNIAGGTARPCRRGARRCLGSVAGELFPLPLERQLEYRASLADRFVRGHRERLAALGGER